ncbi:MAG: hydantoinase B/oxoprolinase family protein [Promethearchaeia archaeon]
MNIENLRLNVIINALRSITEEMGASLIRTAYSTNIKDRKDCSCAIYNLDGNMIAQGEFMPVHLGVMPFALKEIIKTISLQDLQEGDIIIDNDPYRMGSHLWDVMLFAPVFYNNKLIAFVGNIAHHVDIGGTSGVSFEIFEEGLRIPPIKLMKKGIIQKDILDLILANVRTPRDVKGDLMAQIGSINRGIRGIKELAEKLGVKRFIEVIPYILNYSEKLMRESIKEIPDGEAKFTDFIKVEAIPSLFTGQLEETKLEKFGRIKNLIRIQVKIKKQDSDIFVDFNGSGGRYDGINAPWSITLSATYYAIKAVIAPRTPTNSGSYRCIHVIKPKGNSILNAVFPAAVKGCTSNPAQRIADVIIGALSKLVPKKASACHQDWPVLMIKGIVPDGSRYFSFIETYAGGLGAKYNEDGIDAAQSHMSNTRNAPIEAIEMEYPLKVEKYALIQDSEGAGKYRGGLGIVRCIKLLVNAHVFARVERNKLKPYGLYGGLEGRRAGVGIITPDGKKNKGLPFVIQILKRNSKIFIETNGGGGWGSPIERDPDKVKRDVMNGFISVERALNIYGVIINPETFEVDYEKTKSLREKLKKN